MSPGRTTCDPGSGAFTSTSPETLTMPESPARPGSGVYRTVTVICAGLVLPPMLVVSVAGSFAVALSASVICRDPDGALPGEPYFQAFCATRSDCCAVASAASRARPPCSATCFANAATAQSAVPAAIATIAAATIVSTRETPDCKRRLTPREVPERSFCATRARASAPSERAAAAARRHTLRALPRRSSRRMQRAYT